MTRFLLSLSICLVLVACGGKQLEPDSAFNCDNCEQWNEPQDPFRIYGNSWYVGTAGLASILIETDDGLLLIDGGLPQSASMIVDNIERIGFDARNIEAIFVSHAHFDHAGGVAAIQRYTGAPVYSSVAGARTLESGQLQPDDPQYRGADALQEFVPIANVVAVNDGDVLNFGGVSIEAVYTPGHTPGGMTWTWESCVLDKCYDLVYADSLSPVSVEGFLFSNSNAEQQLIDSVDTLSRLNCDIFLAPHPFFFGLQDKLPKRDEGNPFVNDVACSIYAEASLDRLQQRLQVEQKEFVGTDDLLDIEPPSLDAL